MKLLAFLLPLLLLLNQNTYASHIVGGEISLQHLTENNYQITLHLYFDEHHGNQGAKDKNIYISIFNKRNNTIKGNVYVPLLSSVLLKNENDCSSSPLRTSLLTYQTTIYLNPFDYNDPSGYYLSWERCCRNMDIKNILLPSKTGSVFYLEISFPSRGNSSPIFKNLNNFYACKGKTFTTSFEAADIDNDSLAYSIVTPLKGNTDTLNPRIYGLPAPYDSVEWKSGYAAARQIPGKIPFNINARTGYISFNADSAGLYVVAIKCEEYRNRKKIGEVRREFQLYVGDCPIVFPPSISFKGGTQINYNSGDTINIDMNTSNCYNVSVIDSSIFDSEFSHSVNIIKNEKAVKGISTSYYFPDTEIYSVHDSIHGKFCIQATCKGFNTGNSLYTTTLTAKNNGCPSASSDPFKITFRVDPIINHPPEIVYQKEIKEYMVGEPIKLFVKGIDQDKGDSLSFDISVDDIPLTDIGIESNKSTDSVYAKINWQPDCNTINKGSYLFKYVLKDNNCMKAGSDTLYIPVKFKNFFADPTVKASNLLTPNNDKANDFLTIDYLLENYCTNKYQNIKIFNRWGSDVFYSTSVDFIWNPKDVPDGVYFYSLSYDKKIFKGWMQVLR